MKLLISILIAIAFVFITTQLNEKEIIEQHGIKEPTHKTLKLRPKRAYKSVSKKSSVVIRSEVETPQSAPNTGSCHDWMRQAGVTDIQNAYELIMRESGCNPSIFNSGGSGAGGIPQALPASKMGCAMDSSGAVCQIKWMQGYCVSRYGSWAAANQFQKSNGWY